MVIMLLHQHHIIQHTLLLLLIHRKEPVHLGLDGGGADTAAEGEQAVTQQLVLRQLTPGTSSWGGQQ